MPLLVMANKQDLLSALSPAEVSAVSLAVLLDVDFFLPRVLFVPHVIVNFETADDTLIVLFSACFTFLC